MSLNTFTYITEDLYYTIYYIYLIIW